MQRRAVVIIPSEEDYKARLDAQEKAESKDVPDNAVMEMKGIETRHRGVTFLFFFTPRPNAEGDLFICGQIIASFTDTVREKKILRQP